MLLAKKKKHAATNNKITVTYELINAVEVNHKKIIRRLNLQYLFLNNKNYKISNASAASISISKISEALKLLRCNRFTFVNTC